MGKIFISWLTKITFKIWRVTFLKSVLSLKQFGMDFRFRAIDDLPRAHWDEAEFRLHVDDLTPFFLVAFKIVLTLSKNYVALPYIKIHLPFNDLSVF